MNNKKPLTEPAELRLLTLLHTRMTLTEKQKQHLINLQKGHEGEIQFQALTEPLQCEGIILHDLLLKVSNSIFQLDSLILTAEAIYLFEVKNF